MATTGEHGLARLRRVSDGDHHVVLTGHQGRVHCCAFSPDGTLVATTGNDHTARLWHVRDGSPAAVLTGHTGWVIGGAFSPDGTLLATTSEGTVRLWQLTTHRSRCALRIGHALTGIAWHPTGTKLCVVGGAGAHLLTYLP